MKYQIDKRHPKLVKLYGEHCQKFKRPPSDIEWQDRCKACKAVCLDEYRLCRPVPKVKKSKRVDSELKIRRRTKKQKKPKKEKPRSYETCGGPLEENCAKCPKFPACLFKIKETGKPIDWHSKLPHFIIDKYMRECTHAEWKVFCCLNRHADFDPSSNNFGRCWPKYETIAKETGVYKNYIGECCRGLEGLGLIIITHQKRQIGDKTVTVNHFTVSWFKRIKELRRELATAN
jgi:hypothetical protein